MNSMENLHNRDHEAEQYDNKIDLSTVELAKRILKNTIYEKDSDLPDGFRREAEDVLSHLSNAKEESDS